MTLRHHLGLTALTLLALFALAPRVRAAAPNDAVTMRPVTTIKDVAYYDGKDADLLRHKLDIYLPRGKKDFPVFVLVHGGGWMLGSKDILGLYSAVGEFLAECGIGAVLPNYRLSPWVKHPEHARDVARAIAWTVKNIAKHGGDPKRLFLGGHSAGGHLAALLATDETYLKDVGLKRQSLRGVAAISGVYQIPDKIALELPPLGDNPSETFLLGFNPFDIVFGKDPEARRRASPISHVTEGLPPFLVAYAERELPLLPEMAEDFIKALKDKKCDVSRLKVEERRHGNIIFRATKREDPMARAILEFVARHERGASR